MIRGLTPLIRQPGEVGIHLDTDLSGDTDDACALAILLGWPGVVIRAITTVAGPGGRRAADVECLLRLAGRDDIPLAAGAEVSSTMLGRADPIDDERQWPATNAPRPSPPGAALDLLERSLDAGATLIAIGRRLEPVRQHDVLSFQPHPEDRPARVVLGEDGAAFRESWLSESRRLRAAPPRCRTTC
jgi:hypothetical protein